MLGLPPSQYWVIFTLFD